jgi:hypothetical protein
VHVPETARPLIHELRDVGCSILQTSFWLESESGCPRLTRDVPTALRGS